MVGMTLCLASVCASAFDHGYRDWNQLLVKNVKSLPSGNASQVDYRAIKNERPRFQAVLASFSTVTEAEYLRWTKAQQLAFLINAYNAWTIDLILGKYPDLRSIKDLGSVFQSPWKKKFIPLFGRDVSLDEIEHEMIRAPGVFNEPRIHVAVVCASVGCPMLRPEAFLPERLDAQLEDSMRRFLADQSRNRFDTATGQLSVSKIFDWYRQDFEKGHQGFTALNSVWARYAASLADTPQAQEKLRRGEFRLAFLDYDWRLNDVAAAP
jgi:hypothetical protein